MSVRMRGVTPDKHPEWLFHEDGRLRVRITPVEGTEVFPGVIGADPPPAKANMYKEGWCEYDAPCPVLGGQGNPKITLDDGTVIWGYECWWQPVERPKVQ